MRKEALVPSPYTRSKINAGRTLYCLKRKKKLSTDDPRQKALSAKYNRVLKTEKYEG
jgi:hypothetical protein